MREGAFRANLHDERTASLIGTALGIAFALAFITGLISHELQHPASWFPLPTRPVWFYRVTQGVHVASGMAAIPLLLAKLWTVYPKLFAWPPLKSLAHGLERLSIAVLVAGAIFELATGLLNTVQWYPWHFDFTKTHFWVAWVTVGALLVHLAVKAPAIARGWRRSEAAVAVATPIEENAGAGDEGAGDEEESAVGSGVAASNASASNAVSRRALLTATGLAVGVVTITTVGQSVNSLRSVDLLAPRDPSFGPQGIPINKTAAEAGVVALAFHPDWRLGVVGPEPYQLTLAQLNALPQYDAVLPIACVEGWSANGHWAGVRLRDLLDRARVPSGSDVNIVSLQPGGPYSVTTMQHEYTRDPLTLLALRLNGEPLSIDHGYPARIIAPGRPGVLQTKWVSRIEVI
ncbi:molybdopterin-dependent oxidoreductase [Actinocrinis sp.]|jgi:DMSO/TMAO reductase YedYZ molybdopterin-dependent catalytic subunit|uniref:molybdopterin-dependent oxidoreductase n=1 Tax=Actinocrinis sp. TaxID=1920516 RepID=UPI0032C22134